MALRKMRYEGDPVLNKVAKEVKELTPRTKELIGDMLDTMYHENGVGLAAPQVGILKRICVIDVGEGPYVFINPEIIEARALDQNMNPFEVEGTELFARAMCHEFDHLDGHLYIEKVEGGLKDVVYEEGE